MLATMWEWGGLKLDKEDFKVVKGNANLDDNFEKISEIAELNGFEYYGQNEDNKYVSMFMNQNNKIILEVSILTFNFKLVYANQMMSGFLDTGWHENITRDELLHQVMLEFIEPVSILRKYYEA